MENEQWKDIPGYEGRYQVSNHGRVRSLLFCRNGRILKPDIVSNGYARVHFQFKKTFLLHRLVASAFIPNPKNLATVNHIDGDKTNNHVSNLEWSSYSDNMRHSWRNLKSYRNRKLSLPRGEESFKAKLKAEQVIEIRRLYAAGGVSQQKLAQRYGVSKPAIRALITRKTWAHLV